jgi:hypothetical protein
MNSTDHLRCVRNRLFAIDPSDIASGLRTVMRSSGGIKGLGSAGASGLLAVLLPAHFGTVDQFAVKALATITALPEHAAILDMNPQSIKVGEAVTLINIMRAKADENNRAFGTRYWTPRKIDKILWTYGRTPSID